MSEVGKKRKTQTSSQEIASELEKTKIFPTSSHRRPRTSRQTSQTSTRRTSPIVLSSVSPPFSRRKPSP
jgi:hypothetical protein